MTATTSVFSEFEVRSIGLIFSGESAGTVLPCVGSAEEECTVRKVTKKCRGVVSKRVYRGTGEGTAKVSCHIPYNLFVKMFGMKLSTLKSDIFAYGQGSIHPEFCLTEDVFDEDGNEKLRAYPNCIASAGPARKITNGEEEVAEVELDIEFGPDSYGNGLYEMTKAEAVSVFGSVDNFMTKFNPDTAQAAEDDPEEA